MGKTYKHGGRWKKDRRDKDFQKSKKFKEIQHGQHGHCYKPVEFSPIEEEYDIDSNNI